MRSLILSICLVMNAMAFGQSVATDKEARDYLLAQRQAKLNQIKQLEQQLVEARKELAALQDTKLADIKQQMMQEQAIGRIPAAQAPPNPAAVAATNGPFDSQQNREDYAKQKKTLDFIEGTLAITEETRRLEDGADPSITKRTDAEIQRQTARIQQMSADVAALEAAYDQWAKALPAGETLTGLKGKTLGDAQKLLGTVIHTAAITDGYTSYTVETPQYTLTFSIAQGEAIISKVFVTKKAT